MLSLRLRWYVLATAKVLHRHWQSLLLSVLLLLPTMPVFAQTRLLGAPVLAPLNPEHSLEWRFLWVHTLESIGVLWMSMQRTAISGGPFAGFIKSLPVSRRRHRAIDAIVVLVASTPLFLPVTAAAISFAFVSHKTSHYLYILDLTTITLGCQMAALSKTIRNGIPLVVANLILIGALETDNTTRTALLFASFIVAAFALIHAPMAIPARAKLRSKSLRRPTGRLITTATLTLPPFVNLQFGIVRRHLAGTASRCVVMGAVATTTCYLMDLWSYDARVVPLTLLAQAVIALIAATNYRDLRASHVRAAHFVRSLPLSSMGQVRADVLTVASLALPFMTAAPALLVAHGGVKVHFAAVIVFAGTPLLALLYLPQRYAPRETVSLSAIAAALWVVIAWQLLV